MSKVSVLQAAILHHFTPVEAVRCQWAQYPLGSQATWTLTCVGIVERSLESELSQKNVPGLENFLHSSVLGIKHQPREKFAFFLCNAISDRLFQGESHLSHS